MSSTGTFGATRESPLWERQRRRVRKMLIAVNSLARLCGRMLERRRSRIALLELSDHQLKDLGISRADAYREAIRPFWD